MPTRKKSCTKNPPVRKGRREKKKKEWTARPPPLGVGDGEVGNTSYEAELTSWEQENNSQRRSRGQFKVTRSRNPASDAGACSKEVATGNSNAAAGGHD